jgi:hypothetical protein
MMRRFAQAAVVAAAMSAPVFAGAMIAPQAQADPYPRPIHGVRLETVTNPDGSTTSFYVPVTAAAQTPQGANSFKQSIRDEGGKASSSPTTFPGPNQNPPGPKSK